MSKTYAIPDIHGRFDLLTRAFDSIARHAAGEPYTIITLGDYIDRGPESRQVVERLMAGPDGDYRLICLKGNHEDMMVETLLAPMHPSWWIGNGGGATLISYGHPRRGDFDASVVPRAHLDWMDALPLFREDAHRIYVHAGVDPTIRLSDHGAEILLWKRYQPNDEQGHSNRHVVHGHTPDEDGPIILSGRTNLDTYAVGTERLVVGVFDDDRAGGPIDVIEVRAVARASA